MREEILIMDLFLIENSSKELGVVGYNEITYIKNLENWHIEEKEDCFDLIINADRDKKIKIKDIKTLKDLEDCIIITTEKGNYVITTL